MESYSPDPDGRALQVPKRQEVVLDEVPISSRYVRVVPNCECPISPCNANTIAFALSKEPVGKSHVEGVREEGSDRRALTRFTSRHSACPLRFKPATASPERCARSRSATGSATPVGVLRGPPRRWRATSRARLAPIASHRGSAATFRASTSPPRICLPALALGSSRRSCRHASAHECAAAAAMKCCRAASATS